MARQAVKNPSTTETFTLTLNGAAYPFPPNTIQFFEQAVYDLAEMTTAISAGKLVDVDSFDVNIVPPLTNPGPIYISGGKVGIDDNTPTEKLDVAGGLKLGAALQTDNGTIEFDGTNLRGREAGAWFNLSAGSVPLFTAGAAEDIYYNPAGTPRVGIGETNPVETLDIGGGVKLGAAIQTADGTVEFDGTDIRGRISGAWVNLNGGGALWSEITAGTFLFYDGAGTNYGVRIGDNAFEGTNPTFEVNPPANRTPIYLWDHIEPPNIVLSSKSTGELGFFIDPPTVDQNEKIDFNCIVRFDDTPPPTGNPVNAFYLYGEDRSGAGTVVPKFWTEEGDVILLFKAAALTAIDNSAIDAVYEATEQGVMENNRTRISEIEAVLQGIGVLA